MMRRGLTIVELFVVLAILSAILVMLLPAVQAARERAREAVCKNNLNQLNLALAQFAEAHKQLPKPSAPGKSGGWMVEILPFIEHRNLKDHIVIGTPIANVPPALHLPPPVFRCPRRTALDRTLEKTMLPAHYVFVPGSKRDTFLVFDAPTALSAPWISGPEMEYNAVTKSTGPHYGGFFYASGFQQGVRFMLNGQDVQ